MCMQCKETRELIAKTSGNRLLTHDEFKQAIKESLEAINSQSPQRVPHELPRRDAGS